MRTVPIKSHTVRYVLIKRHSMRSVLIKSHSMRYVLIKSHSMRTVLIKSHSMRTVLIKSHSMRTVLIKVSLRTVLIKSHSMRTILIKSLRLSWSYGSWIYNYLCNQCLSPLNLADDDVYPIQHYVIKFVTDLGEFCGFLWFPPPITGCQVSYFFLYIFLFFPHFLYFPVLGLRFLYFPIFQYKKEKKRMDNENSESCGLSSWYWLFVSVMGNMKNNKV
jgi:hypothetical protein